MLSGLCKVVLPLGALFVVFADAAEQVSEVSGSEFPVERRCGLVVAVGEGEQGFG